MGKILAYGESVKFIVFRWFVFGACDSTLISGRLVLQFGGGVVFYFKIALIAKKKCVMNIISSTFRNC